MSLLFAAWAFAALNTAWHLGKGDLSLWFWVNAFCMLVIPVVGIVMSRDHP